MKSSSPKPDSLEATYRKRRETVLVKLASNLEAYLMDCTRGQKRIDRISARAKDVDRFLKKAVTVSKDGPKYSEPLEQIQDQLGARIVVFYKADVDRIDALIKRYFTAIEYRKVVPDSVSEFGYFGHHLILKLPTDIVENDMAEDSVPEFFELQIKTLFQHAWSEADHDLGYKPGETELTSDQKRLVAFTAAQAWGADHHFDHLFQERIRD
jgi:ppGpp synthetase/RelA/SpoT-type nucleotidyltranferase